MQESFKQCINTVKKSRNLDSTCYNVKPNLTHSYKVNNEFMYA